MQTDASVYLPPVTGTGSAPGDNTYFTGLILREFMDRGYLTARTQQQARLSMTAAINAHESRDGGRPVSGIEDDGLFHRRRPVYVLNLTLRDTNSGRSLINQDLFYSEPDEIDDLITLTFRELPPASEFTRQGPEQILPEQALPEQALTEHALPEHTPYNWRDESWFFGAALAWAPRFYINEDISVHSANIGFALFAEYHFLNMLAVGTGLELAQDWVVVTEWNDYHFRYFVLGIPFLARFVFYPSDNNIFAPYLGINFNIPLSQDVKLPLLSWRLGLQYGIRFGPGILMLDPWISMDIGRSTVGAREINPIPYQRFMIHLGIGYTVGLNAIRYRHRSDNTAGRP
ncbi:MAG: hypothetical protein FWG89_06440 [Treponema sp.]|nr:hypothetical protein [Treponema sp.]